MNADMETASNLAVSKSVSGKRNRVYLPFGEVLSVTAA